MRARRWVGSAAFVALAAVAILLLVPGVAAALGGLVAGLWVSTMALVAQLIAGMLGH
ncbi:MAG: hypothetical protein AB7O98_12290 [Hyphomonadaceae bacterium]